MKEKQKSRSRKVKIVFIDNYDSFVYNLVQYFGTITEDLKVFRNDCVSIEKISSLKPDGIVISPGPGRPENAGNSVEIIKKFYKKVPILGVCLGHQAIGYTFGAKIVRAKKIFHGKTSIITHNEKDIFKGVRNPLSVVRYHSLVIESQTKHFEVTAKTPDNEIMAIKLKNFPVYGVQFHPESILTDDGFKIVNNFYKICAKK
ncbi:MAG: aminodeoxychorismate/anthranilate synthase component II [Elusimicrobia bacterium]|nr:aminodeoxychorismate/anthranilate synthase component II [Elusimicrobiota bacterium]